MDIGATGDFAVFDLPGPGPGRHAGYADVEVLLPGGQDERAQVGLAVAMGWPLAVGAAVVKPTAGVSRCRAGFPVDLPGGDQQMTLVVSLPLLARWSEPHRRSVISEILQRLDQAGIPYKLIQVAGGGVLYLPKTSGKS